MHFRIKNWNFSILLYNSFFSLFRFGRASVINYLACMKHCWLYSELVRFGWCGCANAARPFEKNTNVENLIINHLNGERIEKKPPTQRKKNVFFCLFDIPLFNFVFVLSMVGGATATATAIAVVVVFFFHLLLLQLTVFGWQFKLSV